MSVKCKKGSCLAIIPWLGITLSTVFATLTAAAGERPVPEEFAGFHDRWASALGDLGISGMAMVVVRGDEVIYTDVIGTCDPEKKNPVTPDTMFYIASCTKSFLAMAVVALAEEGKLELDAPVKKYLPKFQIADSALAQSITLRDLLSHSKGVDSEPIVFLDAFTGEITEDRFYRWLPEAKAAGKLDYSNLHYTLLGRIIESVTGKSWQQFLDERVFQPGGMVRTTCSASRLYGDKNVAIPCEVEDGKIVISAKRKTDRTMHAAGGMGASVNDLGRWLRININQGFIEGKRVVSERGVSAMQTAQAKGELNAPSLPGLVRQGYGLGWFVGTLHGKPLVEHGGGYIGASAQVMILPQEKIGVAVVANLGGPGASAAAYELLSRLIHVEVADPLPQLKAQSKRYFEGRKKERDKLGRNPTEGEGLSLPHKAYAGVYAQADWGTFELEIRDGKLVGKIGDLPLRFGSSGKDAFILDADEMPGRFEIGANGQVKAMIVRMMKDSGDVRFVRK